MDEYTLNSFHFSGIQMEDPHSYLSLENSYLDEYTKASSDILISAS